MTNVTENQTETATASSPVAIAPVQTARKATTNWPTGHYTFDELQAMNMDIVPITLRCRNANNSEVYIIGKIKKPGVGRPKDVYIIGNPTDEMLDTAKNSGVDIETPVKLKKTKQVTAKVSVPVAQHSEPLPNVATTATDVVASAPITEQSEQLVSETTEIPTNANA